MNFKRKFKQEKFDKMISKAFDYLNKNVEDSNERFEALMNNKRISSAIAEYDLKRTVDEAKEVKENRVEAVDPLIIHLNYPVDKLPDGRNNWTTENVYHLISIWMLARDPETGRYDPAVKQRVAYKYGFYEDSITNTVNRLVNETLNKDKYKIIEKGLLTKEQLIRFKYRDKKVRNNCIKNGKLTQEELEVINKAYKL